VAQLLDEVLQATQPAGSKAKYQLDPAVAARVQARAGELTAAHPLYPEIDVTG
jgi:glycine hydroxymethyltransferase